MGNGDAVRPTGVSRIMPDLLVRGMRGLMAPLPELLLLLLLCVFAHSPVLCERDLVIRVDAPLLSSCSAENLSCLGRRITSMDGNIQGRVL